MIQPDHFLAKPANLVELVADKDDGAAAAGDFTHLPQAFFLKYHISHSQNLINQQRLGLQVGGDGKCQARLHSAAVMFQRRIDKISDLGKGHDLIELAIDFFFAHAENRAVQVGVFAARQLRVKTGAHFEEAPHPAMDFSMSDRGMRDPGKNLQQCGFSRPIPADQAHHFAPAQFERDVAQRPKIALASGRSTAVRTQPAYWRLHGMGEPLAHSRLASQRANAVALPQTLRGNSEFTHASNHVCDGALHGVVINQPGQDQQYHGSR